MIAEPVDVVAEEELPLLALRACAVCAEPCFGLLCDECQADLQAEKRDPGR